MGTSFGSLRHVVRRLARTPMFTAVTLLTIALGIGANTAIFSIVNGILLKPLPYQDPDKLVGLWLTAPGLGVAELNASPSVYFTYREEGRVFEDVGLWRTETYGVTGTAEPEQVDSLVVTDGTLPILGAKPLLGRLFTKKDDTYGSPETVMLTWGYWQRRLGGDPGVIGRRLIIDGKAREVIGVMPKEFRFMSRTASLIIPFQFKRAEVFVGNFSHQGVARLKPGVTMQQANADVARMIPMMSTKFPLPPGFSQKMFDDIRIGPNVRPLMRDVVGDVGKVLWVLMATVVLVLLIACANVANLLLVRAEGRQQELAIRAALGAGWGRIARELLLESVVLGVMGGAMGLGLAYGGLKLLMAIGPEYLPRLEEIGIDARVLAFTLLASLVSGLLFGLIPVFKYAGSRIGTSLRDGNRNASGGRERHRARSVLVVAQVAIALVLLICSGLMMRTVQALLHVQPGFTDPKHIQTLRVSIADGAVKEPERVLQIMQEIVRKMEAVPGVTSVGVTNSVTMDGYTDNDPIFDEDHPTAEGKMPALRRFKFVSPGYFHTMGNRLIAGRDLTWTDLQEKRPVVVISENFARELWGQPGAALGKRVRESPKGLWREIVGVVGDERDNGANEKATTIVHWPLLVAKFWDQETQIRRYPAFVVRTDRAGSASLLKELRQAVWSVNPDLPIASVRTVEEIYRGSMARTSFTLVLLGIASGLALVLGVIGIYGVISYSVSQRTREIGIRMALGATRESVSGMFVKHGVLLAGIGIGCGLVAAASVSRVMKSLLFEVSPLDPLTYIAVPLILMIAALIATYLPARRATGIDPSDALRSE
jgi:putative ABC transport system permease protein